MATISQSPPPSAESPPRRAHTTHTPTDQPPQRYPQLSCAVVYRGRNLQPSIRGLSAPRVSTPQFWPPTFFGCVPCPCIRHPASFFVAFVPPTPLYQIARCNSAADCPPGLDGRTVQPRTDIEPCSRAMVIGAQNPVGEFCASMSTAEKNEHHTQLRN
jgi:hypothetical protein